MPRPKTIEPKLSERGIELTKPVEETKSLDRSKVGEAPRKVDGKNRDPKREPAR